MKYLNRFFAFLLALTVMLGMLSTATAAEGDAPQEVDPYIIHFYVQGDGYTGPRYQYFSPYVLDALYDGGVCREQHYVRNLYNTVTQEVIPAYCTDMVTVAQTGKVYRQLNLEDSTYAAAAGGLLRAIVNNGFYLSNDPNETEANHAVRVAEELQILGAAAGVEDLTIGEAVAATQSAVWQASHGTRLEMVDFVYSIYKNSSTSMTKYFNLCIDEFNNGHIDYTLGYGGAVKIEPECDLWINERIRTVYDYLLALEPMAPTKKIVSEAAFLGTASTTPKRNSDGTYNVTITATVDVQMDEGDELTLTASAAGEYFASASLRNGQQAVKLTLQNLPEDVAYGELEVQIDGEQATNDVYLFEAQGGRDANQSMVGRSNSRARVHAKTSVKNDRIVNILKTTGDGTTPLEGIIFDGYFAVSMDDYISGKADMPDPETFAYPAKPDFTIVTDSYGQGTFNLSQHGFPDGLYIIVEREHPAIVAPIKPFVLNIPMTNSYGEQDYTINLQPKNEIKGSVEIDKDVEKIGRNVAAATPVEKQRWIINTTIPADIAEGKLYIVSDTLDSRLDYAGNLLVQLENVDGSEVYYTLVEGTDYTVLLHDYDSVGDGKPHDSITVSLTKTGMQKIADTVVNSTFEAYMLRTYFETYVNANANVGDSISNEAILEYVNSVNFRFLKASDKSTLVIGAARLRKVDANDPNKTLAGAQFQLFRRATEDEVAEGDYIVRLDGVVEPLVQVMFYDNPEFTGTKVTHATTDANGNAGFYGLPYGEYYLYEIQAPAGYNLLGKPSIITIDETSHTDERIIVVENVSGTVLPETGGIGTTVFTVFGVLLMCASVAFLLLRKREN